ncbi:MAG: hypothetical protein Kow0062_10000 [Acidobacteriota bacterium]
MRRLAALLGLAALLIAIVVVLMVSARSTRELAPAAIAVSTPDRAADEPTADGTGDGTAAGTPARRLREMRRATDEHSRAVEETLEQVP